jgi:foldase protein PrsA
MRNLKLLWTFTAVLLAATVFLSVKLVLITRESPARAVQAVLNTTQDKTAAKIGQQEIAESTLRERLYQKYGKELLNQMLDRQAISMEAESLGIKVADPEIDGELKRMQQGYESEELFYLSMQEQLGMSRGELREDVGYKLLAEAIATRDIHISDNEINSYVASHPDEFRTSIQYKILQIINDTQAQAAKTAEMARAGADFMKLAKERSLDTGTAAEGGDLGWIEEKDPFVPGPIRKAASTMKVGEVSKPIALGDGFAVIKLADRKEQSPGSPEQIRSSVRKQLALQKAPPIKNIIQGLREKLHAAILDPKLQS